MRSLAIFLFVLPLAAQTERFSLGLTGGVPFGRMTGSLPFGPDESRRYTFGLTFEAHFTDHISVNFTPQYRRTGVHYGAIPGSNLLSDPQAQQVLYNSGNVRSHSLELPFIGKYAFGDAHRTWRPFAGAGFSFQTAWQGNSSTYVLHDPTINVNRTFNSNFESRTPFDVGAVFATGLTIKRGRWQYVPEIRYTRWGAPDTSHGRSQTDALFSFRF